MKAIILAAGRSTRLYPLTLEKPKCLLPFNRKTLIEHQLDILDYCGITEKIIVTGYLGEKIKAVVGTRARYREYPHFASTNNLGTLQYIHEKYGELNDDVVILFSDVLCGTPILQRCGQDTQDFCLLIQEYPVLANTMRVRIKENSIYDIGSHISVQEGQGNFIGIAKYSKKGAELLAREMKNLALDTKNDKAYYIAGLIPLVKHGVKIGFQIVREPWIEIDLLEDYEKAKKEVYPLVKIGDEKL